MTGGRSVRRIELPAASAIRDWYEGADLLDSYGVAVAADDVPMREIAQRALATPPRWFKALMAVRDGLVGPFGVRTSDELRRERRDRPHIDFFPLLSESADEIVLGEDDSHLDFRLSLLRQAGPSGPMLVATTAVRTHNRLGRLYLRVIHPFHIFIVRSTVARAAARR